MKLRSRTAAFIAQQRCTPWCALMLRASLTSCITLIMVGCAVVPPYRAPVSTLPETWHAPMPDGGDRTTANWWITFDDPAVAVLVQWAEQSNPTIDRAVAQIALARAGLAEQRASRVPEVTGSASLLRVRGADLQDDEARVTSRSAGFDASWELDLFGRQRHAREAAQARVDARIADRAAAGVTLAAEVADSYVQYRACRLLEAGYAEQAASSQETARITAAAVQAGFSAPMDNDLAQAGAANARATRIEQQTTCEALVKALVALTGASEPTLRQTIDSRRDGLPMPATFVVMQVPAQLLRHRPDIASAERALAAASADIGQAEADRYPSLSLVGSISISVLGGAASVITDSLGPSLLLPVFDGGRRRAVVSSAEASRDTALADYQASLRSAVREVEQALVRLYGAALRSDDAAEAATRYERYFRSSEVDWRAGGINLLALEEARRAAVTAQTTLVSLRREQLRYYIALYKAIGGGWETDTPVAPANEEKGNS